MNNIMIKTFIKFFDNFYNFKFELLNRSSMYVYLKVFSRKIYLEKQEDWLRDL